MVLISTDDALVRPVKFTISLRRVSYKEVASSYWWCDKLHFFISFLSENLFLHTLIANIRISVLSHVRPHVCHRYAMAFEAAITNFRHLQVSALSIVALFSLSRIEFPLKGRALGITFRTDKTECAITWLHRFRFA